MKKSQDIFKFFLKVNHTISNRKHDCILKNQSLNEYSYDIWKHMFLIYLKSNICLTIINASSLHSLWFNVWTYVFLNYIFEHI